MLCRRASLCLLIEWGTNLNCCTVEPGPTSGLWACSVCIFSSHPIPWTVDCGSTAGLPHTQPTDSGGLSTPPGPLPVRSSLKLLPPKNILISPSFSPPSPLFLQSSFIRSLFRPSPSYFPFSLPLLSSFSPSPSSLFPPLLTQGPGKLLGHVCPHHSRLHS